MGFFSWKTQDTNRQIINTYCAEVHTWLETFKVIMTDNKGNKWEEDNYEGYGVFGGKDYYELLAEMNGLGSDRDAGIRLAFHNSPDGRNPEAIHPSLSECGAWFDGEAPEIDPNQGFFQEDDEEEEDKGWWNEEED